MKKLTLQIDRPCFKAILSGEQKIEHRFIYPSNERRYVTQEVAIDENGEEYVDINPVHYDVLYLINGRRKDAPRLTVEVEKAEFVVLTDPDTGEDLTYEQDGETLLVCQVWYYLGNVIATENLENLEPKAKSK